MSRFRRRAAVSILFAALLPLPGTSATAQIGQAVALAPVAGRDAPDLVVLRPTAQRGNAALLVYRRGPDGWRRATTLAPASAVAPYEGFSASLAVAEDVIVAGAADAEGRGAASRYVRGDDGWRVDARVPLIEDAGTGAAGGGMTMARLVGIMRPPQRLVALDAGGARLAVWAERGDGIRVLRATGGGWETEAVLEPGEGGGFGRRPALAIRDDLLVVGVPDQGPGGRLLFFQNSPAGWREVAVLEPDEPGAALGAALALGEEGIVAGAPGIGAVYPLVTDQTGAWRLADPVRPAPDAAGGDGFGSALAVDGDALWVGAPGAQDRRGEVHRFRREGTEGPWRHTGILTGDTTRAAFGAAIALRDATAAVGAPLGDAGAGRVAVFERSAAGWGLTSWIRGGEPLESVARGERACVDGHAAGFECHDVDLLAFLSIPSLGGEDRHRVSDAWGWTDPDTGREYALIGITDGMAILDVTHPSDPVHLGIVPANPSGARDIKTFRDHAFFTGDGAGSHGLVVFDLTRLRDVAGTPTRFEPDTIYTGIASAHNLIMEAERGVAIAVGASGGGQSCGGGFHMVDVSAPLQPTFRGCYTDDVGLIAPGRTHDGQCVVYHGPDARYHDRQICIASNETALRFLDITRPDSVIEIAKATYPAAAYTHQGWLTEDHRYFFMNDELDELAGLATRTRTLIWDVSVLDDPVLVGEHLGPDGATDHNLFIRDDLLFEANYQAGVHILDIADPENPVPIGSFDTTPYEGNPPGFATGAWTAFPFLDSGTLVVTSMYEGVFLLRPRRLVP